MTDFTETAMRQMCRNPKCRSKLPKPVSNPRDAFCARGCSDGFYRTRCRVCEEKFERKNEREQVCGRRKCRNAFSNKRGHFFGLKYPDRYQGSQAVFPASKTLDSIGSKQALADDRAWHIVAGEISAESFHCATVDDGGSFRRIEAQNRAALKAAFTERGAAAHFQRDVPPLTDRDALRFIFAAAEKRTPRFSAVAAEDLDTIPAFLRR